MKKVLLVFCLLAILYSCNTKSTYVNLDELERKSLESGIVIDTIFDDFYFGMPEWRIKQILFFYDYDKYKFEIKELTKYNFNIYPCFYNDSLYSLRFIAYNYSNSTLSKYSLDPIVDIYTLKYGNSDTIYSNVFESEIDYHNVWYKGNLKIDVNYSNHRYRGLEIEYRDVRRKKLRKDIIDNENGKYIWTKDYYENIHLPNKRKELDGI